MPVQAERARRALWDVLFAGTCSPIALAARVCWLFEERVGLHVLASSEGVYFKIFPDILISRKADEEERVTPEGQTQGPRAGEIGPYRLQGQRDAMARSASPSMRQVSHSDRTLAPCAL